MSTFCCFDDKTSPKERDLLQPEERQAATKIHQGLATPDDSLLQVNAVGISATEIRIDWVQYLDEYLNHPYKIRYRKADKKKPLGGVISDYKKVRVTCGNSYTLRNLKPDTQYEVGVVDKSLAVEEQEYTTCYAWTMAKLRPGRRKGKEDVMLEAST